ncbi:MAG: Retron-type RNA-directed DNA polymerase [Candidatus Carbobacillus altaicus]|uniref:Retron-type RNA-directed DNA polymerase n=1 Tax=Candidatus Carbonibacillus altaicus TaxID=2163959 RepID=A0A2R6Y2H3_9BACL|nr:MAG: Retron-type RNA-directed DNA polymerase [Candidatus Carbobacillus altaicus]
MKANKGAAGVDGETLADIVKQGEYPFLSECQRLLKEGKYHPQPVRRQYIPKKDGKQRPLGIPTVRDRVIQMATKLVIEPIFEADFQESSFGFRPKRSAKQALDRIRKACNRKGHWVVDVDIQGYFDSINQEKLMKLLEMRISDRRILKLVRKWLKAGVMEEGTVRRSDLGTPQGGLCKASHKDPCGVPSSDLTTTPLTSTPDSRYARMSLRTRLSLTFLATFAMRMS